MNRLRYPLTNKNRVARSPGASSLGKDATGGPFVPCMMFDYVRALRK